MDKKKGVIFLVTAMALFTTMQIFVALADPRITIFHQIFVRNMLGVFVAYFMLKKDAASQKEKLAMFGKKADQKFLFARSIIGYFGLMLSFFAVRNGILADVTIISETGPFFTTIFSVLFLREKLSKIQIPALIILFAGGWIAANPSFDSEFIPLGSAMLAAVCSGTCYTLLRCLV